MCDLIEIEQHIKDQISNGIVIPNTLIELNGLPLINKCTINILQGKQGSHKSRLAENICSILLSQTYEFAGLKKACGEDITVCYIDTERNTVHEFPEAIERILSQSHLSITSPLIRFSSVKKVLRKERMDAIRNYIEGLRKGTLNHLFIVLDVLSDFIGDFNNVEQTMELTDYLGNLIEDNDVTLLLVIHENPFSDKARGNLGTESVNKASTVMSIGFEKNRSQDTTDLIKLDFIKTRRIAKPSALHLKFDDIQNSLRIAKEHEIKKVVADRRLKASTEQIVKTLGEFMISGKEYTQKEVFSQIKAIYECSDNTIRDRLDDIIKNKTTIKIADGVDYYLDKNVNSGVKTVYLLKQKIN
ncbi:MAG: hypothetical protein MUF45_01390 [Spirosomaceae bacterium]|jgi:hypothetical protein|nr:hypothetical protein [Spirosomataceae bacterium]